jgi:DNA (cytosine-5)-methyltransferase 1
MHSFPMTKNTVPLGDKYMDISKAADRLGVHPETLRRWERKGTIKAKRTPSGHRRFLKADIDGLLTERAGNPAA